MQRGIGVAGFNDHVNLLTYCARPFTIELHEGYRRTSLAFGDTVLNAASKIEGVGIAARTMVPSLPTIALCHIMSARMSQPLTNNMIANIL